jgi:glycosyltransferase involved in cell wall biosynthesis
MKQEEFFVSVIVPVYNGEAFLEGVVDNICQQAWQPLEIIIVDDGSTDATADIAGQLKANVRYVRQPNQGPAAARNRGIEMAGGNVIGFLDADDLWAGEKIAAQVEYLAENPAVDIVLGKTQFMRESEGADGKKTFDAYLKPGVFLNLGSGLFRKAVFDRVGVFDPNLIYSEDADWFLRARELGVSIAVMDQVVLFYRLHEKNMTRGKTPEEIGFLRVLKSSLDRRRNLT